MAGGLTPADIAWMRSLDAPRPPATPPRACGDCVSFEPDSINPLAGAGRCIGVRRGESMYPNNDLKCNGWTSRCD